MAGFAEALITMKTGGKASLSHWDNYRFIVIKGDKILYQDGSEYELKSEEILSNEWTGVYSKES